jgi:hypothetical protein
MRVLSIQVAKLRVNYSLVGFPTFHERRNDLLFIYLFIYAKQNWGTINF